MRGKSKPSSKQTPVPLTCWPSDRCCVGAAVFSELKGLADTQRLWTLERKEDRRETSKTGKTASLSQGGPRKTTALIFLLLSSESEPRSPQLSTSHAWRQVTQGQRKAQEVVGLGCDTAIPRCLIWCLSAISARLPTRGLGNIQTTGTTGIFITPSKASE